jgi:hypothetical protein
LAAGKSHTSCTSSIDETLARRTRRTITEPLSLGQLTRFFMRMWDLCSIIQMNFEDDNYPEDEVFGFFNGSSEFYPDFDRLLRRRVSTFVNRVREERVEADQQ